MKIMALSFMSLVCLALMLSGCPAAGAQNSTTGTIPMEIGLSYRILTTGATTGITGTIQSIADGWVTVSGDSGTFYVSIDKIASFSVQQ